MKKEKAIEEVLKELNEAAGVEKPFASAHEGFALIVEDLDALWEEIKRPEFIRDNDGLKQEAVQVAVKAIRFLVDVVK